MTQTRKTLSAVVLVAAAAATANAQSLQPAAGEHAAGLSPGEVSRFFSGLTQFNRSFNTADGLGPIFNQNSCSSCHNNPVGGSGSIFVTRFGFADKGFFDPLDNLGGTLLQANAIDESCIETIPAVANVTAKRVTSSILGAGFVEAIPDNDILANETNPPAPGISGRVHWTVPAEDPDGPVRAGRFGWKGGVATILTFSADATINEMGITNRLFEEENAPNGDPALLALCDNVPDPEDVADGEGFEFIDRVTDFSRYLAVPPQTPRSGMTGEALFNQVNCNACHVSTFVTADDPTLEDALRNKTIKPYSDFLIHAMGGSADFIAEGDASEFEMKTTPLWGVSLRDPMWHDGRVTGGTFESRILEAIAFHNVPGSEAQASAQAFDMLTPAEKSSVIDFLASLGRREFDANRDNIIDEVDFTDFLACFNGGAGITPDDPCAINDIDQDGDVDLDDFELFLSVYTGPNGDCDNDGIDNLTEILLGAADTNGDLIPDSCQGPACPGNANGDTVVNLSDLNLVLANFGASTSTGDVTGDGQVNLSDLNLVLANFGTTCP